MKRRSELTARDVSMLHDELVKRLGDTSVPTLPHVAVRIIELMSDPTAAMGDFAEVLKTDQALSARLLRMANSAQFAQRKEVTTIDRAAVLIGLDRLKATALGFHLSQAATASGSPERQKQVWTQSLYRACLAFRLAEMIDRSVAGEAFVAGLLLDAGVPILAELGGEEAATIVDGQSDPAALYAEEFNTLPFTHVDVVTVLTRIWSLPELLVDPIARHHRKPKSNWRDSREGVLHAVCYFSGSLILNKEAASMYTPPLRSMAQAYFNLIGEDLSDVLEKARDDFNATREMFAEVTDRTVSADQILESANEHLGINEIVEVKTEEHVESIQVGEMSLEILPHRADLVTIYIADDTGSRIGSEQINPKAIEVGDFRDRFLLEGISDDEIQSTIEKVASIAA